MNRRLARRAGGRVSRTLGGRNAGTLSHKTLMVFLALAILLGLFAWAAPKADAVEAQTAATRCGTTVRYDIPGSYAPEAADEAVRWAYAQVAKVADLTAKPAMKADVVFEWQSRLSGTGYAPGTDYFDSSILSDREYMVHAFDGNNPAESLDAVRALVLPRMLLDLGVTNPTSTGEGLSVTDRKVIRQLCKAQAAAGPVADTDSDSDDPAGADGAAGGGLWASLKAALPEPRYDSSAATQGPTGFVRAVGVLGYSIVALLVLVNLVRPSVFVRDRSAGVEAANGSIQPGTSVFDRVRNAARTVAETTRRLLGRAR